MISKYLKSKNTLDQIQSPLDDEQLLKDNGNKWYLKAYPGSELYYLEDQFTDNEISIIKAIAKKLPKEKSTIGLNDEHEEYRKSITTWININDSTSWIYKKLSFLVNQVNANYFNFDLDFISTLQFTEYYCDENMYKPHIDSIFSSTPINRKLTFVVQFSDPSEYEGGNLKLHYNKNPIYIKKQRGSIVFFPSYVLHEVEPVTSGKRETLVGWVEGLQFR